MMKHEFVQTLYRTLEESGPGLMKDHERFLEEMEKSAGGDFGEKIRLLKGQTDQHWLDLCMEAVTGDEGDLERIRKDASAYMQDHFMTAEEPADHLAEEMTGAIFALSRGEALPESSGSVFLQDEPTMIMEEDSEGAETEDVPEEDAGDEYRFAPPPEKKRLTKKAMVIIGAAVAAATLFGFLAVMSIPRDLVINSGNSIETYVGEDYKIPVSAKGLSEAELKDIVWTSDSDKLITIEDGVLKAAYDKNAFHASRGDEGTDDGKYTAMIYGTYSDGMKNWEGDALVDVSLKPVDFKSGELIKEPEGSRDSYIDIKGSDDHNVYFYMKSKTKPENDMSFIVGKGNQEKVHVPVDTYEMYEAYGDTWYGSEILFGPQTYYTKDDKELEFEASSYWTVELGVVDGNTTSTDIASEDFPE